MKLLCDQMLGSLATWLRLLGYDTFYANRDITDDDLLQIAKTEQRTILSRDKEFIYKAKKENIPILEIKTTDLDTQLHAILKQIPVDNTRILSRCTLCNTPLEPIEKNKIQEKVAQRIFEQHDTFWFCTHCNKVYWAGTHYDNISKKLEMLMKKQE